MFTSTACAGASCQQTDRGPSAARQPGSGRRRRRGLARASPGLAAPPPCSGSPTPRQQSASPHSGRPSGDSAPAGSTVHSRPQAQCPDVLPAHQTAKSVREKLSFAKHFYFSKQLKKHVCSPLPHPPRFLSAAPDRGEVTTCFPCPAPTGSGR